MTSQAPFDAFCNEHPRPYPKCPTGQFEGLEGQKPVKKAAKRPAFESGNKSTNMSTAALVIFSGGQDSTACLYWAKANFDRVEAISFDYGQSHRIELEAARVIADMAGVKHEVVAVPDLLRSESPLTNGGRNLETYANYDEMDAIIGDRVELTSVPMRNPLFITIAANRAITNNIKNIVAGICHMDNANYPDCRPSFVEAQERAINEALGIDDFKIHAPLLYLTKKETIEMCMAFDDCMNALAHSHTCYAGTFPPCGKCHSCVLRAKGFELCGVQDPLLQRI